MIRPAMTIVGVLLVLTGAVWSIQGADLIGGSFMSGERQWLVIGLACLVAGLGLLALGRRRTGP